MQAYCSGSTCQNRSLGHGTSHFTVDHHKPLDAEMKRIGIEQADFVAGLTATDQHLAEINKLIAPEGTLALIDDPKVFDVKPLKMKAITVAWELMFTRPLFNARYGTAGFHFERSVRIAGRGRASHHRDNNAWRSDS